MASGGAARRKAEHDADGGASVPRPKGRHTSRRKSTEPDRIIHERVRLAIVSALASVGALSFHELKELLDITDGNLSVHVRRLEEAGFITCEKSFIERVPRTQYRLTVGGRAALDDYLNHMESLIRRVRES